MQDQPRLEQLDWFFTSPEWISVFPNTLVKPLAWPISDHITCVVNIQTSIPKCKLFHFECFWPSHPGFREVVSASWSRPITNSSSATLISAKLKRLRYSLKQ